MQDQGRSTIRRARQIGTNGDSLEAHATSEPRKGLTNLERQWLAGLGASEVDMLAPTVTEPTTPTAAPIPAAAPSPATSARHLEPPLAVPIRASSGPEPAAPGPASGSPAIPDAYRVVVACSLRTDDGPTVQPEQGRSGTGGTVRLDAGTPSP